MDVGTTENPQQTKKNKKKGNNKSANGSKMDRHYDTLYSMHIAHLGKKEGMCLLIWCAHVNQNNIKWL